MSDDQIRILIVEARFYSDLADELLKGATDALEAYGASYEIVTVPGALEIPAAIAFAEEGGHRPGAAAAYDGYVALGTVIRGETYHFEIVSNESARWIMDLTIGKRLCIGNGVLTTEDDVFDVNLIPHTWDVTTLGTLKVGSRVNLEIDMLARYLARWRETA